ACLAFAQRGLGLLERRDVDVRAGDADDSAGSVGSRRTMREQPAVAAVAMPKARFHLQLFARMRDRAIHRGDGGRVVVRVNAITPFLEAVADVLLCIAQLSLPLGGVPNPPGRQVPLEQSDLAGVLGKSQRVLLLRELGEHSIEL